MRTYTPKASEITAQLARRRRRGPRPRPPVPPRSPASCAASTSRPSPPTSTPATTSSSINADKVVLTSGKADQKIVYRHSGYPGGLKPQHLRRRCWPASPRRPSAAPSGACSRRTASAARCSRKLKVYAGPNHPHSAQQPEPLELAARPGRDRR